MIDTLSALWPGLSRPFTSLVTVTKQNVDARDKRGHDESNNPCFGITIQQESSQPANGARKSSRSAGNRQTLDYPK